MSEIIPERTMAGGRGVLHRPLDVQGRAYVVRGASGMGINETYQDENGEHLWTFKRFPGGPPTEFSNVNNPEEVE